MPSDIEMGDSDSSILDTEITLDPEIIEPAPERVAHRCKEYLRYPEYVKNWWQWSQLLGRGLEPTG